MPGRSVAGLPTPRYDPYVQRTDSFRFQGLGIPVQIWGSGPGALVFFPGMGVHPAYYRDGLSLLARHFEIFIPDLSFRTHARLFERFEEYVAFSRAFADRYAPDAPRCGHSVGGLLALLVRGRAIACSPSVPVRASWPRVVGRAVRLQLSEYFGREGLRGAAWAWQIMTDYVRTSLRRPRMLFPPVGGTLRGVTPDLLPACEHAHVILSRKDILYRDDEYREYLTHLPEGRLTVRRLNASHDWPVTRPELFRRTVLEAVSGSGSEAAGG